MIRFAILLLMAGSAVPAAAAEPGDVRSIAVPVHNVMFEDPAAMERLRGKLRVAARRVCPAESGGVQALAAAEACSARAFAQAEAQMLRMAARVRLAQAR